MRYTSAVEGTIGHAGARANITEGQPSAGPLARRIGARWLHCVATLGLALAVGGLPAAVSAAVFNVNATVDGLDALLDGVCQTAVPDQCTLRAAVQEANWSVGITDTILLPGGTFALSLDGQNDDVAVSGDLDLTDSVVLQGQSPGATIIDAAGLLTGDRVFDIISGTTANLSGLTIRGGALVDDFGGGVRNFGTLTLSGAVLTGNSAKEGGGIANSGDMTLTDVALSGNSATGKGGAVRAEGGSNTLARVTMSGNMANDGAGFWIKGTGTTGDFTNATISGNTAFNQGGGIHTERPIALTNVTITGNTSPLGAGINYGGGLAAATLLNTIVANNVTGPDCSTAVISSGYNLDSDGTCGLAGPFDQPSTNPQLGSLADNGGPTSTHALLVGSPAIDTGTNIGCPATDQRGFGRPFNTTCDIGAYEVTGSDIAIDGDFSDWTNGIGNEYCVDDQGGADDWGPGNSQLDITKFCIASNTTNELYALYGFDDVSLSNGKETTSCVLVDTPPNDGNADFFFCVTLAGDPADSDKTMVKEVGGWSCTGPPSPFQCLSPVPISGFVPEYGFSNSTPGPFDALDSMVELKIPWNKLGVSAGDVVLTAMISYPGQSAASGHLNSHKDSIFGGVDINGDPFQDYEKKIRYNIKDGTATTTPVTLSYFLAVGHGNVEFIWQTMTETGNLGFHLYELTASGPRRLNEELIPSRVVDSVEPQEYTFRTHGVDSDVFLLEDVDVFGRVAVHGPFASDIAHGSPAATEQPIAWHRIRQARLSRKLQKAARGAGSTDFRKVRTGYPEARLLVEREGIYRVSYEELAAAGVDLAGAKAKDLALLSQGEPVALRVEGKGKFGPGSFLEFVGEPLDTLYTRSNVYTLQVNRDLASAVAEERSKAASWAQAPESYQESTKVERNLAYHFAARGNDPWHDTRLLAISGPVSASFPLELEGRVEGGGPVLLDVALWGVTDFPETPDHHVVLEVNGVELADERFDGQVDHPLSVEVPEWVLQPVANVLRVILPHDTGVRFDLVNYDHYRVTYPRRFDARNGRLRFAAAAESFRVDGLPSAEVEVYRLDSDGVVRLSKVEVTGQPGAYRASFAGSNDDAIYHVSTVPALLKPAIEVAPPKRELVNGEAELLIIAHPDFVAAVEPLAIAREREGFTVQVVSVEDVYTNFSHGVFDPEAIRAFIRRAFAEMGTDYVLLVGGDTYDYHDYLGQGAISFVPTLYAQTDPIVRFAPTDSLYADVDLDGLPDVAIGRLPVRTLAELEAVLDKTFEYQSISYAGSAVLSADASDSYSGYSFAADSEALVAMLPSDWQLERAYLDDLSLAEARGVLIDRINSGVALTSFFGHSGPTVWSFQGLFSSADADALQNRGRPTVVTQWGCWNTYFVSPSYDTLGHRLLLSPDRGAAAVLGATTLTQAESERQLGQLLFQRLTVPGYTLGSALLAAKRELAMSQPGRLDVLLGWTLLGDPTLVIRP